jgi:8-oxo-dGTP pyrophosphatase MutT (NUDIX family)
MNESGLPISVKAVLWAGRSVLFLKNPRGEWELPGGRPEPGEDEWQTVIREVKEECGFDVTPVRLADRKVCEVVPGKWVDIRFFECDFTRKTLVLSDEHIGAVWIPIIGTRPPDVPCFYWEACARLLTERDLLA